MSAADSNVPRPNSALSEDEIRHSDASFREQLLHRPDDAAAHLRYAVFLAEHDRPDEAAAHFQEALRISPSYAEAHRHFAQLLCDQRQFTNAIDHLWAAIRIRPDDAQALCTLGNALVSAKRPHEAVEILRQAIRLAPVEARLHSNLGLAFSDLGRFEEAEICFLEALHLEPLFAPAHNNLAILYILMGNHRAALSSVELALALNPQSAAARRNRALANLSLGNFDRGWEDYDWCAYGAVRPPDPCPAWNGEPLAARRILLTARQGLGDTLQFIRYAPLLRQQAARVILECPSPLAEILKDAPGVDELAILDTPLPPTDLCVPLLALPRIFRTTLATIPGNTPYLSPSPPRIAAWRTRLAQVAPANHLLVGIAWQGNPNHQWDQFRSLPLICYEPLTTIPGVRLVSLQRGPGIEQIEPFQRLTRNALIVPTDGAQSTPEHLADSAALMSLLDLVITVDTATAHLAGALARPVWVALSRAADWRWMTERSDSPWYPTMRLFRQKTINDWDEVIARIHQHLAGRSAAHAQNPVSTANI